jgi:uncharacterized DUF497 family protein
MMRSLPVEFEWDAGNIDKISARFFLWEVEQFFTQPLLVIDDQRHSETEKRLIAVGLGPQDRPMFVCYTIRSNKIRVISARYMNQSEIKKYETLKKRD